MLEMLEMLSKSTCSILIVLIVLPPGPGPPGVAAFAAPSALRRSTSLGGTLSLMLVLLNAEAKLFMLLVLSMLIALPSLPSLPSLRALPCGDGSLSILGGVLGVAVLMIIILSEKVPLVYIVGVG